MPRNPRANHIYGIQTAGGGFGGFPTGGNLKSGFSDVALDGAEGYTIPTSKIMPKLNNHRRWVHESPMPQHKEDMSYKLDAFSKQVLLYGMPQSTQYLSALSGKASCPETAMIPNPMPIPHYDDLAEVQAEANRQYIEGQATHEEKRFMTASERKRIGRLRRVEAETGLKRMSALAPVPENDLDFVTAEQHGLMDFFKDAAHVRENEVIDKLINKGYTEDEIREYLEEKRKKAIAKAAEGDVFDAYGVEQALVEMRRSRPTGTNAAGIVALGATQNVSVTKLALNELAGSLGVATRDKFRWAKGEDSVASALTQAQPRDEIVTVMNLVKQPQVGKKQAVRRALSVDGQEQLPFAEPKKELAKEPPMEVYIKQLLGGTRKMRAPHSAETKEKQRKAALELHARKREQKKMAMEDYPA